MSHTGRYTDHGLFVYVDNGDDMTFDEWIRTNKSYARFTPDSYKYSYSDLKDAWASALENQWVSVKDKFPPDDKDVFVIDTYGNVAAAFYDYDGWRNALDESIITHSITHWMVSPELPK